MAFVLVCSEVKGIERNFNVSERRNMEAIMETNTLEISGYTDVDEFL